MIVKVLSYQNFDGQGGRVLPHGVQFSNPVPVLRDFDVRAVVGHAVLEKRVDGVYADVPDALLAASVGLAPGVALRYPKRHERAIPRLIPVGAIEAVSLNPRPNPDPTIGRIA